MIFEGEKVLLRVQLRSNDRRGWFAPPAAEELIARARTAGLAGATLLEGIYGLDENGNVLQTSVWSLATRLPLIVEFIDSPAVIGRFLDTVAEIVREGLATLERAHVLVYRVAHPSASPVAMPHTVPTSVTPLSTLPDPEEFPIMKLAENGLLVRIFIGEADLWEKQPLYRAVILKAKELGLAGATVLRGPMGFGANSRVHSNRLVETSSDLPIVIEIVDAPEKIELLLPFLDTVVKEGLVTVEEVRVLHYRHNPQKTH